jgi:MFS family permease
MFSALATSWSLLLGMALLMLGNGLQGTLLGVRANLEGFSTTITGVLMSGYFAGFLIGSTLTPRLVQRVGHVRTFAALASLASTSILIHSVFVEPLTWMLMRLVSGFCYAGLYVVAESWLNEKSTNANRGQLLSIYMVISLGGMGLGQILLNLADPAGAELFILVSVLVSLALLPMLLSRVHVPVNGDGNGSRAGIRDLFKTSPTGVVGMFMTLIAQGAFSGMGAVYAGQVGLSVRQISFFMGAMVLGGVLLQWPIGRLSDRFDRRRVLTAVTLLAAALAALAGTLGAADETVLYAVVLLYGGMALPMYSLCIAYTNDYLDPDQMVEASGTLVLVAGLGASLGPVSAAIAMDLFGSGGFFWMIAAVHGLLGLFALYRMTVRRAPPLEDQGTYVAVPRTTALTTAWAAEVAAGDAAEGEEPERSETGIAQPRG